jgi:hypothetical protein
MLYGAGIIYTMHLQQVWRDGDVEPAFFLYRPDIVQLPVQCIA